MILFTKTQSLLSYSKIFYNLRTPFSNSASKVPSVSAVWGKHKYLKLIQDLRNPEYFQVLIQQQKILIDQKIDRHPNFKSLRGNINDLVYLMKLKKWGHAYHGGVLEMKGGLSKIQKWLELAFSEKISQTHENLQEQSRSNFQAINFYVYFELQQRIPSQISMFYFNSYMHLLRDRWPFQLMRAFQAIKETQLGQIQRMIIESSQIYLKKIVQQIQKEQSIRRLNQIEMGLMISYYKNRLSSMEQAKKQELRKLLLVYLKSDNDDHNSYIHLQNTVYILYLCTGQLSALPEIVEWLHQKYTLLSQNATSIYLATLFSHQDKHTCLKVDIWVSILNYLSKQSELAKEYRQLGYLGNSIVQQLYNMNFTTWKYKYAVWLLNSVVSDLRLKNSVIVALQKAVVGYSLASNRLLSSFIGPFTIYTYSQNLPTDILILETQVANWLSSQTSEALLSQPASVLCEILPHADRHPALHVIYLPYLQRLLQVSLGQFQWSVLTQLYYFGLRWKAQQGEEGYWRMQYVRRYIMNEYAVMGILRRQIPEDSYFYKIHEETTPQRFYANFSN